MPSESAELDLTAEHGARHGGDNVGEGRRLVRLVGKCRVRPRPEPVVIGRPQLARGKCPGADDGTAEYLAVDEVFLILGHGIVQGTAGRGTRGEGDGALR